MKRRAFLPLIPAAFLPSCGKEPPSLKVGMEVDYPPFEFLDASGEPDGVEVHMAKALAKYLGLPLKLENYSFEGLIPALESGKIDVIISAMTATDERRKSIDFSDPYVRTAIAMLVHKDSKITSVEDLKKPGIHVAVKIGTTGESYTLQHLPEAKCQRFDKEVGCILDVENGKSDAFIYDQLSLYKAAKNSDKVKAILKPIREEEWGIGIKQKNDALRTKVNAFIKQFRESGELNKLADEYLVEERKMLQEMGYPFIFH